MKKYNSISEYLVQIKKLVEIFVVIGSSSFVEEHIMQFFYGFSQE